MWGIVLKMHTVYAKLVVVVRREAAEIGGEMGLLWEKLVKWGTPVVRGKSKAQYKDDTPADPMYAIGNVAPRNYGSNSRLR